MDLIELRGMAFLGRHGVRQGERERTQEFKVDLDIEADLSAAGDSDNLGDTVDYRAARAAAKEVIEGKPMALIESLATAIALRVLALPRVDAVTVRVVKYPASMQPFDGAAVRIKRTRG